MKPKFKIEFVFILLVKTIINFFPRYIALKIGGQIGKILYFLDRAHRKTVLKNLYIAFKNEKSEKELNEIAKNTFIHFGKVIADIFKSLYIKKEELLKIVEINGIENLENALRNKKGVLLFSAHYGNWEIAVLRLALEHDAICWLARKMDNPYLENIISKVRQSFGSKIIYKKNATREVLSHLRKNTIIGILIDQNILEKEGLFVDFLGEKASTTPFLAIFHLRTGAPIIPMFCVPDSNYKYYVKLYPPIQFENYDPSIKNQLKITQFCTKIIEKEVKENPAFWFWFHKRWKTRPKGERSLYEDFS
ncbi:MAG: lysophospholipid acyltransferase family protein [Acidobacteriota bacterium]